MMFVITRLSATVAVLAVVLAGAAACNRAPREPTDVVSDVDLARAAVLSGDPMLKNAVAEPEVTPGRFHSTEVGWDRSQVSANLYLVHTGPDKVDPAPAEVEQQLGSLVKIVRDGGWNVHWAVCMPATSLSFAIDPTPTPTPSSDPSPSPSPSPSPEASPEPSASPSPTPPGPLTNVPDEVPVYGGWEEILMINKTVDGVSYWGMLVATIFPQEGAFIGVVLRAPNMRDAAHLLPASLPALPAGGTCAEDGVQSAKIQAAGEPVLIKDWQPFPGAGRSPDPHRL
jgi:hypothetical protein